MSHKPRQGYEKQRFTITIEGYTRYVSGSGLSADVTLILPKKTASLRDAAGRPSDEVAIGSLPLKDVTWLPDPPNVGDVVSSQDDVVNHLPPGTLIKGTASRSLLYLDAEKGWVGPHGLHGEFTIEYLPE